MNKFDRFPLLVGLAVAFLVLILALITGLGSRGFRGDQNIQTPPVNNKGELNSQVKPVGHSLTVDQPEDNLVVQNPTLTVVGRTTAGATVVIIAGEETQLADADFSGNFSFNLTLQEGATSIEVTSFNQNGEEQNVTREVFYSAETI